VRGVLAAGLFAGLVAIMDTKDKLALFGPKEAGAMIATVNGT